jgi:hypothetical protein
VCYFKQGAFDPEAIQVMSDALEGVVRALGLSGEAEKQRAAAIIIRLAKKKSELQIARLRDETTKLLYAENIVH